MTSDVRWAALGSVLTLVVWIPGAALANLLGAPSDEGSARSVLVLAAQLTALGLAGFFGGFVPSRFRDDLSSRRRRIAVGAASGAFTGCLPSGLLFLSIRDARSSLFSLGGVLLFAVPVLALALVSAGGAAWGARKKQPA